MFSGKSGWRGLGIYLAAVGVVTLAVEFPVYRTVGWLLLMLQLMAASFAPGMAQRIATFAMRSGSATVFFELLLPSFAPAIAWLLARSVTGEGFADGSLRIPDKQVAKQMLIAWVCPAVLGLAVYGTAWLAGATRFGPVGTWYPFGHWGPEMLLGISVKAMRPMAGFVVRLVSCLFFSIVYCAWSLGMELGWRGYLLPKLVEMEVSRPMFWTGLAWGLVYLPGMMRPVPGQLQQEARWISSIFFVAGAIGLSYILGYLRLRSGSIWPPVLGYATWSCVMGMAYDGLTIANPFWRGELYLLSVALGAAVLFLVPRPWRRLDADTLSKVDVNVASGV